MKMYSNFYFKGAKNPERMKNNIRKINHFCFTCAKHHFNWHTKYDNLWNFKIKNNPYLLYQEEVLEDIASAIDSEYMIWTKDLEDYCFDKLKEIEKELHILEENKEEIKSSDYLFAFHRYKALYGLYSYFYEKYKAEPYIDYTPHYY